MASGKRSALLSSLADYGDDSEPDSDFEPEDSGVLWSFSHDLIDPILKKKKKNSIKSERS